MKATIKDAPACLNTNDKAMWVLGFNEAASQQPARKALTEWQPIETAPKDGTEVLGWREDCGVLLIRWTSCSELMADPEIEQSGIDDAVLFAEDWFYADIMQGGRMEGSETPTYWMPLPDAPIEAAHGIPGSEG
jgi:hypothetical protein